MINSKKFERLVKALGEDTVQELNTLSPEDLKARIILAEMSVKSAQEELEANPKYQEIIEKIKAIREGFSFVKKRQKAITQYSLHLLEEKGLNNE